LNTENPDLKVAELWLQAQQQLQLTAIKLMRNQRAEPSEPAKTFGNVAKRPNETSGIESTGADQWFDSCRHKSESCRR
jgi:hypothetical protein